MKISIVIGAGASHESGTDHNGQPIPLGSNLYSTLTRSYPHTWGKYIPKELDTVFNEEGFEQGMLRVWEKTPDYFTKLLIDMATYFSYCKPNKYNNYVAIIESLVINKLIENTNIVSLNYECVFEMLLSHFRYAISYTCGDYDSSRAVRVWKPHGSCNFLPDITGNNTVIDPGPNNPNARYFETDGFPKIATSMENVRKFLYSNKIPPFMSLYEPSKTTLSGSLFIEKIRRSMADSLLKSDLIIIIGVKPNFDDKYIWDPIFDSDSKARVWYVGTLNEEFTKRNDKVSSDRMTYIGKRFHESTPKLQFLLKN